MTTNQQPITKNNPPLPVFNGGHIKSLSLNGSSNNSTQNEYQVIRRNGKVTTFDPSKIMVALSKAFLAVEGDNAADSSRIHEMVQSLTDRVVTALTRRLSENRHLHIEDIQDQVELALMRDGEQKVARSYVLYREKRTQQRIAEEETAQKVEDKIEFHLNVTLPDGTKKPLDTDRLKALIHEACLGLKDVDAERIMTDTCHNLFDGIKLADISQVLVMAARTLIEKEPHYSQVASRLLLDVLRHDALNFLNLPEVITQKQMGECYADYYHQYLNKAIELELIDPELATYDLDKITAAIQPERDLSFTYLGLQTLFDRYFIHTEAGIRFELPQAFFMRVSMGLAINESDREARAIEFYDLLSSFDFMSSTPTLFNSGTLRPQLSSCYLTTISDDLDGIYNAIKDNALLSKFAGGLGNDWSAVRGLGAHIKGTNGKSQGVVPFLKVANDTAVAVNQCFAGETLIYTENGTTAIKNINVGDLVLGQRGVYRQVKETMHYPQTDSMVVIDPKHSIFPINVTAGHPLWGLQNVPMNQTNQRSMNWLEKEKIKPQWIDAGKLQAGDYLGMVIPKETVAIAGFEVDDARLYGILLGDGHCSKGGLEWGVSGNPDKDQHLNFVKSYLKQRGIHYWVKNSSENELQIGWSSSIGLANNGTTGQAISGNQIGFTMAYDELYNAAGQKRIQRKYSHLPKAQTLALIHGLLETDGCVIRGREITFTNTSQALIDGLRYQLLRLAVPCSGQFNALVKSYDLRIPAIKPIAEKLGCKILSKQNWLVWNGCIFTRIKSVKERIPSALVYDLKVEGDPSYMTTNGLAHNGGKRKGAVCAYLESWHLDIEEFLELRKNTGDERRRTHDMNTANWIPDLFMKRVADEGMWTLFSPNETADLHELYGQDFEKAYAAYENKAERGEIKLFKQIKAVDLWRKMLVFLFETGHPWITFKDPCNIRYTNNHIGVVHSSNLCTEITLHTNKEEIAVCNLGSINLPAHMDENGLNHQKLEKTIKTAIRMLDNVVDYNFYSVPQARHSNLQHRPIGLGVMGYQDALYQLRTAYSSQAAIDFADQSMEAISYYSIQASSDLAVERGKYSTFEGSLWSKGILPIDSIQQLEEQRGSRYLQQDRSMTLDWDKLRQKVVKQGMRNSNCLAIAPTATISHICGISQSIEPIYQNMYVKSNLSGEFMVVNPYLVNDLKKIDLWDDVMINDLKYFDGCLASIERIPEEIKTLYATAFEIDPRWLVEAASRRQKWIDQGQSLNLYMEEPSGKKLDNLYKLAWVRGLKTTYYLRSKGATGAEKTSVQYQQREAPKVCSILDPDCDACQ